MSWFKSVGFWITALASALTISTGVPALMDRLGPKDLGPVTTDLLAQQLRQACPSLSPSHITSFATAQDVKREQVEHFAEDFCRRRRLLEDSQRRGTEAARRGDYDAAHREFESATELDPGDAMTWSNRAALYALEGKNDEARRAYDQALLQAPDDWRVLYNFGLLLARTDHASDAADHLSRAFEQLRGRPEMSRELSAALHEVETDSTLAAFRRSSPYQSLDRSQ